MIDDIVQSQKEVSIALYASEEYVRIRLATMIDDIVQKLLL